MDGSWHHVRSIYHNLHQLHRIPKLKLSAQYETAFWRTQQHDASHLATIEAIYYCAVEFAVAGGEDYAGQFDLLMLYFKYFHQLIGGMVAR